MTQPAEGPPPVLLIIAMSIMVLLGTIALYSTAVDMIDEIRIGRASRSWPSTVGTIESSWLEHHRRADSTPHISYRFELHGEVVRSDRVGGNAGHDDPDELVAAFPVGARVAVYYDPVTRQSSLVRGVESETYERLALAVLGMLTVAAIVLRLLWQLLDERRTREWSL